MSLGTSPYRERFELTMAHKPVDRCPIDLAGMPQSTIEDDLAIQRLAKYLGLPGERPADYDKFDRRILEHFDIDFRRAGGIVQFETGLNRAISDREFIDCYGATHRFEGIHWATVENPLGGATIDDVAAYRFPTITQTRIEQMDEWAARARSLFENTDYVVVGEHPVFGVLELACWLCGYDYLMTMMALEPEFIHLLFGKILEFQKVVIGDYYGRIGQHIHLTTSGDDFGTQKALFMSPAMWREYVKPYMKARIDYTRLFTDAPYLHHSCGAIFDIIPDLIEIGVDVLNPVQPGAAGMDPARLKAAHGEEIVFHGGLDTQEVLPSNDPDKIDAAVHHLLDVMNPTADGGYIFAPAHVFQCDVAPAAIARMYETALRR